MDLININTVSKNKQMTSSNIDYMSEKSIKEVREFHKSFKEYKETPLLRLKNLSDYLGINNLFVKDESYRFGLNAFKVLGGAYAVGKYLADKLSMDIKDLDFEFLRRPDIKEKLGDITFVTATDGNHGRGVAWAASQLGQNSVVYMPKGSSKTRLEKIRNEGAHAEIINGDYDDAVDLSYKNSIEHGWVVIQDTAWNGYEDIPIWIMQGYGTIMDEALEQINKLGIEKITHVFLQAGVGSFAGSMVGYLVKKYQEDRPISVIVEPTNVAGLYKSSIEGKVVSVNQDPTIMAGLACGTPNTVSWDILYNYANAFLSCPDYVSAKGMRVLSSPLGDDERVISGESGAVGIGALFFITKDRTYIDVKNKLELNEDSNVLIISTEGDTDPQKFIDIVWDGEYPSI